MSKQGNELNAQQADTKSTWEQDLKAFMQALHSLAVARSKLEDHPEFDELQSRVRKKREHRIFWATDDFVEVAAATLYELRPDEKLPF
jgi:hypothetical protein